MLYTEGARVQEALALKHSMPSHRGRPAPKLSDLNHKDPTHPHIPSLGEEGHVCCSRDGLQPKAQSTWAMSSHPNKVLDMLLLSSFLGTQITYFLCIDIASRIRAPTSPTLKTEGLWLLARGGSRGSCFLPSLGTLWAYGCLRLEDADRVLGVPVLSALRIIWHLEGHGDSVTILIIPL